MQKKKQHTLSKSERNWFSATRVTRYYLIMLFTKEFFIIKYIYVYREKRYTL